MQVLLNIDRLDEPVNKMRYNYIDHYYEPGMPITVYGIIRSKEENEAEGSDGVTYYLAGKHIGDNVAVWDWGTHRVKQGTHTWESFGLIPHTHTIEDYRDYCRQHDVAFHWLPVELTLPSSNKTAKHVLTKFEM